MLAAIDEFAGLLRGAGVRVSTGEVIDAVRAASAVGVDDPARLHLALRASLVKRPPDVPLFDELFELYFVRMGELAVDESSDSLVRKLAESGAGPELVAFFAERLAEEGAELSAVARRLLGLPAAELAALMREAGARAGLGTMTSSVQAGLVSYRMQGRLGIDGAETEARAAVARLRAAGVIDAGAESALGLVLSENSARLRDQVRDFVRTEFARQHGNDDRRATVRALSSRPLVTLSPAEVRDLRDEVARLASLLAARLRRRHTLHRRGRLDAARTLRASLATDGIPFEVHWRRQLPRKPRLVILCDISDSVRHVSDFMLHFVYALVSCFERVDAFAFVAEIGEMSALFRDNDVDRAIELVHQGAVVNVFSSSNYGSALEQFRNRYLGRVTRRATVLIIGDGRTNYYPPRASIVGQLHGQARQVIWLTPEGPSGWGFGDSAMHEYRQHVDHVAVARDLDSLRKVVDRLVEPARRMR